MVQGPSPLTGGLMGELVARTVPGEGSVSRQGSSGRFELFGPRGGAILCLENAVFMMAQRVSFERSEWLFGCRFFA